MESECRFEPSFARCAECGNETDEHGTCEDFALCWKCRRELNEAMGMVGGKAEYGEMVITAIEGHGYKPPTRVIHYSNGDGPICHARGGPHPVTNSRHATNCKRCVKALGG